MEFFLSTGVFLPFLLNFQQLFQPAFTFSKFTIETLEQDVNYVQS